MSSPSIKTAIAYHNLIYEIFIFSVFFFQNISHLDGEKNAKKIKYPNCQPVSRNFAQRLPGFDSYHKINMRY